VDRYRVHARDFLDAATRRFIRTPLRDLSRATLIHDAELRATVSRAETALGEGDLVHGAEQLALAFELTLWMFRERQPWRRRGNLDHYRLRQAVDALKAPKVNSTLLRKLKEMLGSIETKQRSTTSDIGKIAHAALGGGLGATDPLLHVLQGFNTELQYLNERAEAGALVADVGDHAWFRARVGRTQLVAADAHRFVPADPPLRTGESPRALNFVIETALRFQRLAASPAPTGSAAGRTERREWERMKESILEVAERQGQVTVDDLVLALDDPSPDDVEPALGELVEQGRLARVAPELYVLVGTVDEDAPSP
jgi:hypothetical protein